MNTIRLVLCILLLVGFVSGCQGRTPESEADAPNTIETVSETGTQSATFNPLVPKSGAEALKGYELYSWQEEGQWHYSVLIGTNREKTLAEIQAPEARLKGVEELQSLLESVPAGQFVTWLLRASLVFPPEEMVTQVQEICKRQGLELGIVK